MAKESPQADPQISAKIAELAELIATSVGSRISGQFDLDKFKCTVDYACTGAEFTCSTFRCPAAFKVEEVR